MQITVNRTPTRRGAAQPSTDGTARITIPLQLRLSASELTRALLAAPATPDLATLTPVQTRAALAAVLAQHGYAVLTGTTFDGCEERHQDARRAIRDAYGARFQDHQDEQQFLAEPLLLSMRDESLCGQP
ncbi:MULTISPECIES: DUF6181 family protein [Streptacidiphilus]|uniref:DUF6181 family protein n=1 Tax=Streptacidiphilus cavernicola TaxID=3342716 RepID=A0ABV6UP06_9ACTN|nr:DUF6181 family protein [Streptacidiphilus jeojiense]